MTITTRHAAQIAACMRRIYAQRLTTASGGNISVRDDAGAVWISGAAIDKGAIAEKHVVRVSADASRHFESGAASIRPSSELPLHRAIYAARQDLKAIVHAHSPALVASTLIARVPDTRLVPSAYCICGDVAWTDYCTPGTDALGKQLAEVFSKGHDVALMQNHGAVVGGSSLEEALCRFETLEFTAQSIEAASPLGTPTPVEPAASQAYKNIFEDALAPKHFRRSTTVPSGLAREVVETLRRGYRRHLIMPGRGSVSKRVDHHCFCITPPSCDPATLVSAQLLKLDIRPPIADAYFETHRQLYQRNPEVEMVFHAYPPYATGFGLLTQPLVAATIPESYIVLREIQQLRFGDMALPERIAERLTAAHPVATISHDGVIVMGRSVLEAFDRLEVLESTAEAMLRASRAGTVRLLSDAELRELPG